MFLLGYGLAVSGQFVSGTTSGTAIYRRPEVKQNITESTLVDFSLINKLGDNFYKLHHFLDFEKGWNGYDGKKFSKATIQRTMSLLKKLHIQPKLFPTGRGSVQLEYHINDDNLVEMEISSTEISALWVIRGVEREEEFADIRIASERLNDFSRQQHDGQ